MRQRQSGEERWAKLRAASVLLIGAAVAGLFAGCTGRGQRDISGSVPAGSAPAAAMAMSTRMHGDHNPHHRGVVLMNGDLHFEVVLDPAGRYAVYFTDAVRSDLPASIASSVTITVERKHEPPEPLTLEIDNSGESWLGQGRRVDDPDAVARIAYTLRGDEPYSIDLPFKIPAAGNATVTNPHTGHTSATPRKAGGS